MEARITIAVEAYRPSYATGQNMIHLQSPISSERRPGDEILVRQDRGEFKNKITFRKPEELVKLDGGPRTAYADGVLLRPDPTNGHREGDRLWLDESAARRPRAGITAVNLRTWEYMTVALDDVCWVPKYRKLDCGEDDLQELLTISGPTVKRPKRGYVLAVVQRLRHRDGTFEVEGLEFREIVEQDLWKYQNLTALPDGSKRIEELFRRTLASVRPDAFSYLDSDQENATQPSSGGSGTAAGSSRAVSLTPSASDITEGTSLSIDIDYSLMDEEEDPAIKQRRLALERKVMAKKARKPTPLLPGPPPVICNLGHKCPTPPKIFFQANMPTLENLYPKHHHQGDHKCPAGAAHELHCVFQFRTDGKGREFVDKTSCTIPPSVRHTCCTTNARPPNKPFAPPPPTVQVGAAGVVVRRARGGRGAGVFSVVGELDSDYTDLPVEVEEMPFEPARDLDEVGRRAFGYSDCVAMAELAASTVNSLCDGGGCQRPDYGLLQQLGQPQPAYGYCVPGLSTFAPVPGWDVQVGPEPLGSVSRPIVVDDDNDEEDEDGDEDIEDEEEIEEEDEDEEEEGVEEGEEDEEPDVFGDRHFQDDEEMDLNDH